MTITIAIQEDTWTELNNRKLPGESFDSVIKRALNEIPDNNSQDSKAERGDLT